MGTTHLSGLAVGGVPTMGQNGIPPTTGNVYFVSSKVGSDGNTGAADQPMATLAAAYAKCIVDNGDTVILLPGHAETVSAAGGINLNKSGVNVVGWGSGSDAPTFTFATSTAATITMTAANNVLTGINATTSVNGLVSPFVVSAADCTLGLQWRDGANNIEALRAVLTTAAANRFNLTLDYIGFTNGSSVVNAVRLVGGRDANLNVSFYGVLTTAIVEFLTTAVIDCDVTIPWGYVSGITNQSRMVVDTVTGSTWGVQGFDGAAGYAISGGSGQAIGTAVVAVPTADSTANTLERDVIGNKTDTAVTTVGTTKSIIAYAKGLINNFGTLVNTGGTASLGAIIGDFANTTLIQKLNLGAANSAANVSVADILGNKTDTAIYVPGTTNSISAYAKGVADLQEGVAVTTAAVMTNGLTLFTVAGGPIQILSLVSICVTANGATASTIQYSSSGTLGATTATISAASASLANTTAGTTVVFQGTTLATAPLVSANAANIQAVMGTGVMVPAGSITAVIGVGSTTGTWTHYIRYRPLAKGVTVTAAF